MGQPTRLTLNGRETEVDAEADTPLLWVLRETLGMKATRFGCGDAACGACTVIVDGRAVTSCDLPLSAVGGAHVETVEGLGPDHPLVEEIVGHQAAQCGYCIPGILMAAKSLIDASDAPPGRAEIAKALDANLCRCGTHTRILKAVEAAAVRMTSERT